MDKMYSDLVGAGAPGWLHELYPWLPVILVWTLLWKGLALWHAGRNGQPWWFTILLIVNTLGILELIYLFVVLQMKPSKLFKK